MFRQEARGSDLRSLPLFADCGPEELKAADSLATRLRLKNGRVLLREGGTDRQLLIIVEGQVGVCRGEESPLAVLSAGDFVGEMAMLTGERRSATVTALTPIEVLVCNDREFATLIERAPSVRDKLIAAAAERIAANSVAA